MIFLLLQNKTVIEQLQQLYLISKMCILIPLKPCYGQVTNDTIYHSRFGYKDLSKAAWGKNSVGILCFQAERAYSVVSPQMAKVMVGIDAEQVRQILQNKIVHDMYFVPERWVGYKNVHYPMLQKDGTPCLSRPGQKVRSPKPFFNVALNDNLFY